MTESLLANMRGQEKRGMKKGNRGKERELEMKKTEGREVKTAVRLFTPQMKPTEERQAGKVGGWLPGWNHHRTYFMTFTYKVLQGLDRSEGQ